MRRLFTLISILVMVFSGGYSYALSTDQIKALQSGVYYFNTEDSVCSSSSVLQGSDNMQQAFNYFVTKGFTPAQSAGIVGNLIQESGVNPLRDEMNDGPGRGIAQWTVNERWAVLLKYAASRGDPRSLALQLDFIMAELTGTYPSTLADLKATTDIKGAVDVFLKEYERAGTANGTSRLAHAEEVLSNYGGSTIGGALSTNQNGCVTNCLPDASTAALDVSAVRKSVICLAQQELALWTPSYDRQNYLKYTQNVPEEWCADFVSWIYYQAGYPISPMPGWRQASVVGVKSFGLAGIKFHYHDAASNYIPVPGDIAIHLDGESHVNLVVDVRGTIVTMIGGDQGKLAGDATYGGPKNGAIVSEYPSPGYYSDGISGYVSPD